MRALTARARAALGLAAVLVTACTSGPPDSVRLASEPTTTTTSTAAPATEPGPTVTSPVPTTAAPATAPPAPAPAGGALPKAVLTSTGVTVPVVGRDGQGLLVGTPCGSTVVVKGGVPLEGTVVLDAGHGGVEPGAVGPNGLTEKELNFEVTAHAKRALEAAGVGVVLTRAGDYRITLEARGKIVSAVKPRAFVSVHHNAEPDGPRPSPGSETYYQTVGTSVAASKRLAGLIYEEIVSALSRYQGVAWVADSDAGAKYRKSSAGDDYYGIVRRSQGTPGTLAELAFLSNPPEAELLARPDVQKVEGEAVARGVTRFLNTADPGSGFTEPYPRDSPAGSGGGSANCKDPSL